MSFVTKYIFKAIMKRLKHRNNYLKNKTDVNKMLYKKQRIYCVALLRKVKTNYYVVLDKKEVSNNKVFWKVVKSLHSNKSHEKEQINLVEKVEILNTDLHAAEI